MIHHLHVRFLRNVSLPIYFYVYLPYHEKRFKIYGNLFAVFSKKKYMLQTRPNDRHFQNRPRTQAELEPPRRRNSLKNEAKVPNNVLMSQTMSSTMLPCPKQCPQQCYHVPNNVLNNVIMSQTMSSTMIPCPKQCPQQCYHVPNNVPMSQKCLHVPNNVPKDDPMSQTMSQTR